MILCIDSGNTRIKYGFSSNSRWQECGALSLPELSRLTQRCQALKPDKIILANVAGESAREAIINALPLGQDGLLEARSTAQAAGVTNGYENPQQLGVDRWCALIGARALTRQDCLVVMAGTATTIDTLNAAGDFCGGLILPGPDLMRRSLARDTAALPLAKGQHTLPPRNTDDAIISGCLEAQAGAIERAFARLSKKPGAACIISGGAAGQITPLLGIPFQPIENLVLEGLIRLA